MVASLVELSPADWVVAVVPPGRAGVPERLAAVVALVALVALPVRAPSKVGAVTLPVVLKITLPVKSLLY